MPQTRFSKFDFKVTHASSRCPAHFLLQFWSDIEELDKHAWVLEPESPNLADIHRRIVVAKHAYLDITIKCDPFRSTSFTPLNQYLCSDAAHPRAAPPTLALVGAEATCAPLRQHIRNYRWSSDKSLLDNILLSSSSCRAQCSRRRGTGCIGVWNLLRIPHGGSFHSISSSVSRISHSFMCCSLVFQIKHVPMLNARKRELFPPIWFEM
jgi:hypothetical protein